MSYNPRLDLQPSELLDQIPQPDGYRAPADPIAYARYTMPDGKVYLALTYDGKDYLEGYEVTPRKISNLFLGRRRFTGFLLSELAFQEAKLDESYVPKRLSEVLGN